MNKKVLTLGLSFALFTGAITGTSELFSPLVVAAKIYNFSDVPPDHWAYEAIQKFVNMNIVSGYDDGTFKPNNTLTEGQFVKIATIALIGDPGESKVGHWAEKYYKVMERKGVLLDGIKDISMRNKKITRGEVAVVLAKLVTGKDMSLKESVDFMYEKNLTTGRYTDKGSNLANFDPNSTLTRAQAVVFMQRVLAGLEKEKVNIPDPNLEHLIRTELDKPKGDITRKDMWNLTELVGVKAKDIVDLTGLEYAKNLKYLDLHRNQQVRNINSLRSLINLEILRLDNNQISDISALENLTNLTSLSLNNNQIRDISALENLTNLTSLSLSNNQIRDISALKNLKNLTTLWLSANPLKSIEPLGNLKKLETLWLYNNSISDISVLRNLTNLKELSIGDNQIRDISALSHLKKLSHLDLNRNKIEKIAPLKGMKLQYLNIENNPYKDYESLKAISPNVELFVYGDIYFSHIGAELNLSKEQVIELFIETNRKADEIIASIITPTMNDYEKVKAIHDYVVLNAAYDYENYIKGTVPAASHSSYGILIKKTGVCEGYANAMNLLFNKVGIDSIFVVGEANGGGHAWNKVKIEDEWYNLDATWDDPVPDREGFVRYDYFLIPDSELEKDHTWDKRLYPPSTSTKFMESLN
ncbi:leucine-rich repeat domain-containing protein [Parageobacillus thermoglucosidasius]|uniref:leucine-rich repeat domain-containing protein n=1 Tax=Parageobacillus thermoglucosidasius TaxID=1426 RepID=UPI00162A007B|nr:leucine-rich repeat domain-containing protein [Parageobacillus thermoglucosidasius]